MVAITVVFLVTLTFIFLFGRSLFKLSKALHEGHKIGEPCCIGYIVCAILSIVAGIETAIYLVRIIVTSIMSLF